MPPLRLLDLVAARRPGRFRADQLTYDSGSTTEPAISPDGKLVAYASDRSGEGNRDIWVQNIANGDRARLAADPADDDRAFIFAGRFQSCVPLGP